jgi:hypothetical protein
MLTWDLSSNRAAHFGLAVFEQLDECGYEVARNHLVIHSFCNFLEPICHHVSHSPALVLEQTPQCTQEYAVAALLLFWHSLGDRDEHVDSE